MRLRPLHAAAFLIAATGCAPDEPTSLLAGVEITPWGHRELHIDPNGDHLPLLLDPEPRFGICLAVPATRDTSQWSARLSIDTFRESAPIAPTVQVGQHLCFDRAIPVDRPTGRLCPEIVDGYDGSRDRLDCLPYRYRDEADLDDDLNQRMLSLLRDRSLSLERRIEGLDELAETARNAALPFRAMRMELVAAYYERRAGESRWAAASARLAEAPAWIDAPIAAEWSGQLNYERALFAVSQGRLEHAWAHLDAAAEAYARIVSPRHITAVMKQSEILARLGAVAEGRERLATALEACDSTTCESRLVRAASNALVWLILQDASAGDAELRTAVELTLTALDQSKASFHSLERANTLINLAFAQLRLNEEPAEAIESARRLLVGPDAAGARATTLKGWTLLVESLWHLENGRPASAREGCQALIEAKHPPHLQAWAQSCLGAAHRELGALDEAGTAYARALLIHEAADSETLQSSGLGTGRRAEDFYAAARVAVERGHPDEAWRLLWSLDARSTLERPGERCAAPEALRQEAAQLATQLDSLEQPAGPDRRRQREATHRLLSRRLQAIARRLADCHATGPLVPDTVDFRAVALDDEILLLQRGSDGRARLHRRSAFPRRRLLDLLAKIDATVSDGTLDATAWSSLVAPLADALLPDERDLGAVTTFALHGPLQHVPLGALPRRTEANGPRWLGDETLVVYRPAGAMAPAVPALPVDGPSQAERAPLFVVDPSSNLPAAAALLDDYRQALPRARMITGAEATRARFLELLPHAGWLHVDAHVRFDAAFPELSRLVLADGWLLAQSLSLPEGRLRFANLSACRSGRWPTTADSGRFGLAGHLNRRGVPWVVGARGELRDRLAADFNRALYSELATGRDLPESLRNALQSVRKSHPPASWANLLLLQAEPLERKGGATDSPEDSLNQGTEDPLRAEADRGGVDET